VRLNLIPTKESVLCAFFSFSAEMCSMRLNG
jgi:hypothetical protein